MSAHPCLQQRDLQNRGSNADRWTDAQNVVHTVDNNSALRRNGTVTPAATRMTPDDAVPGEVSQTPEPGFWPKPTGVVSLEESKSYRQKED